MGPAGANGLIGPQGPSGANGKSTYQLALDSGYTGTEAEWLSSVKGETGAAGADGLAATISVETASRVPFDDNPYVENVGTPQAAVLRFGIPAGLPGAPGAQGAKGDTGPTGADGLSAFEIAEEHGFTGTEAEWLDSVKGDTGPTGADGLSAFEIAEEHGFTGTEAEWLDSVKGDTGPTGADGPIGPTGTLDPDVALFTAVGPNDSADVYSGDSLVFASDTLDISVGQNPATVQIERKSSDTAGTIIPFGTGYAAVALPSTNSSGASVNIVNMGFGECGPGHALTSPGSGVFTISNADAWYTFTMPKDATLKGISMNVTNGVTLPSGTATICPYVVIATAPPTSRTFTFIDETLTRSSESFLNGVSYSQYTKTVAGESPELNVALAKGTQVSIVFGITTTAPGTMAQANFMICAGGLWLQ